MISTAGNTANYTRHRRRAVRAFRGTAFVYIDFSVYRSGVGVPTPTYVYTERALTRVHNILFTAVLTACSNGYKYIIIIIIIIIFIIVLYRRVHAAAGT